MLIAEGRWGGGTRPGSPRLGLARLRNHPPIPAVHTHQGEGTDAPGAGAREPGAVVIFFWAVRASRCSPTTVPGLQRWCCFWLRHLDLFFFFGFRPSLVIIVYSPSSPSPPSLALAALVLTIALPFSVLPRLVWWSSRETQGARRLPQALPSPDGLAVR